MFRLITLFFMLLPTVISAETAGLGSENNPVRAFMPYGEREYLMRLRCQNGKEPEFERIGSFGKGPYGNILDGYKLTCEREVKESVVYIDM